MDSIPKQLQANTGSEKQDRLQYLLLFSVFVIATCGLIYELIAGTLASYLLGDSVTQFSTIIGTYLFAMGIGSWLSKYIDGNLLKWFIRIEILIGLVGGISAPLLFVLFEYVASFRVLLYSIVGLMGILVGMEIPLLMRILQNTVSFKDLVSRVFTFDYIGALLASLIFPLVLVPSLGLIRTSLFFGILNIGVAWLVLYQFNDTTRYRRPFVTTIMLSLAVLLGGFVYAEKIMSFTETLAYQEKVIYAKSTPYQRIVLTRNSREVRLYLNGNLQFSSSDEYRYHEALVHPVLQAFNKPVNVLVLGGGDGFAVREILKYPNVQSITLVDLDPDMTKLFKTNQLLLSLNDSSFLSSKVKIINADAFSWIRKQQQHQFDIAIVDFPDPSNYSIGKLYSNTFYNELQKVLSEDGMAVIQSTSPYIARKSFWCIEQTVQSVGFHTLPYHAYVPSFGEWGYILAAKNYTWHNTGRLPTGLRYVSRATIKDMMYFPPDMQQISTSVNKLNNQVLVHYFEEEWAPYTH